MITCSDLSFTQIFSHVAAHQDDGKAYNTLSQESQLNCQLDFYAKQAIWDETGTTDTMAKRFPLEPICVFLGRDKLTSDKGERLQFQAHKQLAKESFYESKILFEEFNNVNWEMVYLALHQVPRMFQVWACKQVMNIAPANGNRPWETDLCPLCPSCAQVRETCSHVLNCNHDGRVEDLLQSIDLMDNWMMEVNTDPTLRRCIAEYAAGRGNVSMSDIVWGMEGLYQNMAKSQDTIGWRGFM
jgi:hypothetical protein